jgi:hypothetical protein
MFFLIAFDKVVNNFYSSIGPPFSVLRFYLLFILSASPSPLIVFRPMYHLFSVFYPSSFVFLPPSLVL